MNQLHRPSRGPSLFAISRYVLLFRCAAFVPIVAGCLYLLVFMPSLPSIAVLTATVESMSFKVASPDAARLSLRGYALSYEAPVRDLGFGGEHVIRSKTTSAAVCVEGLLTPELGTSVFYERFGSDPVSVELRRDDGKAVGRIDVTKGTLPDAARASSWIRLVAKADDDDKTALTCDGAHMAILPVYGFADIGSEIRPATPGEKQGFGTLLEGSMEIFAHAVDLRSLRRPAQIYPASTSSITIPPGSKVTVSDPEHGKPWVGFAMADSSNDFGLDVRVTTEAKDISIVRPGSGIEPELISIGLFTQLVNDPVLVAAQIVVAFLFSVFEILAGVAAWVAARGRPADTIVLPGPQPPAG